MDIKPVVLELVVEDNPISFVTNPLVVKGEKGDKGDKGDNFISDLYEVTNPAYVWTILHNKGYYPSITVLDSLNRQVLVEIVHDSVNQVTIKFELMFSGKVVVN